ncbi:MAG: hypothetical protein SGARI_006072 [Bacillariaceae sp.]
MAASLIDTMDASMDASLIVHAFKATKLALTTQKKEEAFKMVTGLEKLEPGIQNAIEGTTHAVKMIAVHRDLIQRHVQRVHAVDYVQMSRPCHGFGQDESIMAADNHQMCLFMRIALARLLPEMKEAKTNQLLEDVMKEDDPSIEEA